MYFRRRPWRTPDGGDIANQWMPARARTGEALVDESPDRRHRSIEIV